MPGQIKQHQFNTQMKLQQEDTPSQSIQQHHVQLTKPIKPQQGTPSQSVQHHQLTKQIKLQQGKILQQRMLLNQVVDRRNKVRHFY